MKTVMCSICKKRLTNDNVALSLKMLGKGTSQLLCYECLGERVGCDKEVLIHKVRQLKNVGCAFFAQAYVSEE